jgi:cytoskeletal protein RodZ
MSFSLNRIGQVLRETREERGLSVEEVAIALFLKKRVVGAIEAGDWNGLPHPVYVKGYITQYAAYLDIANLVNEASRTEDEAPGVDDVVKGKKGILRGWRMRKKKAPHPGHSVNAPWSVIDQL